MIEIVSHVYDPPGLDQYSRMFAIQASSLVANPPSCVVRYTVFHAPQSVDPTTWRRIKSFDEMGTLNGSDVIFRPIELEPPKLFRRAYGRDMACAELFETTSCVWFTDVDYAFGNGVVAEVERAFRRDNLKLAFPPKYQVNRTHDLGDEIIAGWPEPPEVAVLNPEDFHPKTAKVAIGGIMLVAAKIARDGYLRDTKWTRPVDALKGFLSCACDKKYRRSLGKEGLHFQPLKLYKPLYRLRHSSAGRNYDLAGGFHDNYKTK